MSVCVCVCVLGIKERVGEMKAQVRELLWESADDGSLLQISKMLP